MVTKIPTYTKDTPEILDYQFDWAANAYLAAGETILTSIITVPTGITINTQTHDTTTSTVWLSGGTIGTTYKLVCTITTNQGRTCVRHLNIKMGEK